MAGMVTHRIPAKPDDAPDLLYWWETRDWRYEICDNPNGPYWKGEREKPINPAVNPLVSHILFLAVEAGGQVGINRESNQKEGGIMPDPGEWIAFADRRPEPQYDPKAKEPKPTHGMILVTNNIEARDRWGKMSHVWLVGMVHYHDDGPHEFAGRVRAEKGEITAFAQPCDMDLRGLTHWRPAVPEEWGEGESS